MKSFIKLNKKIGKIKITNRNYSLFNKKLTQEKLDHQVQSKTSSVSKNNKRNIIISSLVLIAGGAALADFMTNQNSKGNQNSFFFLVIS